MLLEIHININLWQFFLQYCRLQDSNLNENMLHQRDSHRKFQENILAKVNLFEVIEKFPHWPSSQTELMSPWTHHVLFLFKSFFNHYIFHRHFRCCSSILNLDWSVKVRLMYLTVEFKKLVSLAFRRRCWNIISFGLRHFPEISPAAVPWTSLFRTLEHLLPIGILE